jgi:hypothetical protein
MSEDELNAMRFEEIIEPVPPGGTRNDGLVRTLERVEVRQDDVVNIVQTFLLHDHSTIIDSSTEAFVFVQIDA